ILRFACGNRVTEASAENDRHIRPDAAQFLCESFACHHWHSLVCNYHVELPWCPTERLQGLNTTGVHGCLITKAHEHLSSHVRESRLVIDKKDPRIAAGDAMGFWRLKVGRSASNAWEINGKHRPLPWRTGDGDSATVVGNNTIDRGEPHACPFS